MKMSIIFFVAEFIIVWLAYIVWSRRASSSSPSPSLPPSQPNVFHFSEKMPPEQGWFAFVDPEDHSRWLIGWRDWYHIREEGGSSYYHTDERLTWWYSLPKLPMVAAKQQTGEPANNT